MCVCVLNSILPLLCVKKVLFTTQSVFSPNEKGRINSINVPIGQRFIVELVPGRVFCSDTSTVYYRTALLIVPIPFELILIPIKTHKPLLRQRQ